MRCFLPIAALAMTAITACSTARAQDSDWLSGSRAPERATPAAKPAAKANKTGPAPSTAPPAATAAPAPLSVTRLPTEAEQQAADTAMRRGQENYRRGRFETAVAELNEALLLNPRLMEALNLRGLAYLRNGAHDRALQDFNKVLASDPSNGNALLNAGAAHIMRRAYVPALVSFDKYIKLKPLDNAGYITAAARMNWRAASNRRSRPIPRRSGCGRCMR